MCKCIFFVTLAGVSLVPLPSLADGVDQAVDAFHRTCLAHGPDFERTVALAMTRRWTPLSGDAALAPVQGVKAFRGWQAGEDLPNGTTVAVTKGSMEGRAVQTCSVKLPKVDHAEFAEKNAETGKDGQLSKLYVLIAGNRKQVVH